MKIDGDRVEEIAKSIRPLFHDKKRAEEIHVKKGAANFVTEVDLAVQGIMREKLTALYPDVLFMSEEKDNSDVDYEGDFWILDPVDGTTNLIHDLHCSALSLAYAEKGEVVFGIIYQPYTDELYRAEKGKGALLNGQPIHVSGASTMAESLVAVGTTPYEREYARANFDLFYRVFMDAEDIRRGGSAAIDLAQVAAGREDLYFERNLKPWDYAAGAFIVKEAGGSVTTFKGEDLSYRHPLDIVAGNKKTDRILREKYLKDGDALREES